MFKSWARYAASRLDSVAFSFRAATKIGGDILKKHYCSGGNRSAIRLVRRRWIACGLLLVLPMICSLPGEELQGRGLTPPTLVLLNAEEFPKGWSFFSAEKESRLGDTWRVEKAKDAADDVLICRGKPFGYLKTEARFENFEFSVEWNYPNDPNCNSGILIHTGGDDKIWPTSLQVQLHRPAAGSLFPIGGAKSDNTVQIKAPELVLKQWHHCVVRSEGGTITVTINGTEVGKVTGCTPSEGTIALQSEGSEIHFRRIRLQKLQ